MLRTTHTKVIPFVIPALISRKKCCASPRRMRRVNRAPAGFFYTPQRIPPDASLFVPPHVTNSPTKQGSVMKIIITILCTLSLNSVALANNFRCVANPTLEGSLFWLTLDWDSNDLPQGVQMQSLAENGFYSEFPMSITSFAFNKDKSLTLAFIGGDGHLQTIAAAYDANKDNYKGSYTDQGNTIDYTCMELKAF